MAKIKYQAKENRKVGTHSFYAAPVFNGSLSFDEVVSEACENTSIEPSFMRAAITEYMKAVKRNVLKGFRTPVGDDFLTVYPNIQLSVKDKVGANGVVEPATAAMLNAANAKSRLGCSVSAKFSQQFAADVSWQKVNEQGAAVEEAEDITQQNENVEAQADNTQAADSTQADGGTDSSGNGGSGGGDE